ncbi:hypothetical protein [Bradyrhizobium sp. NAS96.2]|uniref:hypothetical protein n=1 Tax=Bradyrhizobium sp. NAS96.2 TaxID=1680160 RepID=UPI0011612A9E|nr:hypothetical protein [Bradyrhizobium sp. NAS96.2]
MTPAIRLSTVSKHTGSARRDLAAPEAEPKKRLSSIDGASAPIPTGLSKGSQSGGDLIASGIKKRRNHQENANHINVLR